jgi:signal transduction histidine kinase
MTILIPLVVLLGGVPPGLQTGEAAATARCAPDIDPRTGQMYPLCQPSIQSKFDLESLDITADAYERGAKLAWRAGRLTKEEFGDRMERVRAARDLHAQAARQF